MADAWLRVVSPQCSRRLEMSPTSSPVVTSYRLPIVTIGLSLIVFTVLRLVTDRRTDEIVLAKGSTMHQSALADKKSEKKPNIMTKISAHSAH